MARGSQALGPCPRATSASAASVSVAAAPEDLLERDPLRVPGPPAQRIVHVHHGAAGRARVQATDDGRHERTVDAGQHDPDALGLQRAVAQRRIQQLAVEEVADHDVVAPAADRLRRRLQRRGQLAAHRGANELVGDARSVTSWRTTATRSRRSPCSLPRAPRAARASRSMRSTRAARPASRASGTSCPLPGAHHRDARTGGHVRVEHRPERVARRRPALEARSRGACVAPRVGERGRAAGGEERPHRGTLGGLQRAASFL